MAAESRLWILTDVTPFYNINPTTQPPTIILRFQPNAVSCLLLLVFPIATLSD